VIVSEFCRFQLAVDDVVSESGNKWAATGNGVFEMVGKLESSKGQSSRRIAQNEGSRLRQGWFGG
jgi:hypothetical protein